MIRPQRDPRGVTLLEVLFSMLIATIGLLGALALLPVAIEQANKGRQADAQAIAGEAAVSDFKVRGFYDSNKWIISESPGVFRIPFDTAKGPLTNLPVNIQSSYTLVDFSQGICFDPLLVSQLDSTLYHNSFRRFPILPTAPDSTKPQMFRVGLNLLGEPKPAIAPTLLPFSVAETCMKSFDEINYSRPQDRSLDAIQRFTAGNLRREIEPLREFSWFATLSPSILNSDEFILGVAVVYRRLLPVVAPASPVPANDADNHEERVFSVIFNGSGDTGGEITLQTDSQDPKYLDLRKGDWVMLSGVTGGKNHYRWYRVIDTEPTVQGTAGNYTRSVTLFGADWPSSVTTQAVVVRGVSAVYERTIRLQQSNLWQ